MSLRASGHTPLSAAGGTGSTTVASGGAVSLTTATVSNITSKVLQPGTYLVWGFIDYQLISATVASFEMGVSNSISSFLGQAGNTNFSPDPNSLLQVANGTLGSNLQTLDSGPIIVTVADVFHGGGPLTVYLNALANFSAGTISAYGTLYSLQINLP
jgi:hypothetical protein